MRRLLDVVRRQRLLVLDRSISVSQACKQMCEQRVGSVLVIDENGALVGIFTGRDAVRRVLAQGKRAEETSLGAVMTPSPVVMSPGRTADEALQLMWDGGFRHLPVVEGKSIIGVVAGGDFTTDERVRFDEERELWEHLR